MAMEQMDCSIDVCALLHQSGYADRILAPKWTNSDYEQKTTIVKQVINTAINDPENDAKNSALYLLGELLVSCIKSQSEMENQLRQKRKRPADVQADLFEQIKAINDKLETIRPSYANSVGSKTDAPKTKSYAAKREAIFIKEPNKGKPVDGNIVYTKVTKILAKDMKINCDNIKILPKSCLVTFLDKKEKETFEQRITSEYKAASIEEPRKIDPRIIIRDFNPTVDEKTICDELKVRNEIKDKDSFRIIKSFTYKNKQNKDKKAIIVTLTGQDRRRIAENGDRIFYGYKSILCRDSFMIKQCYNCLEFGHKANECKNEVRCKRCSGNHNLKDCKTDNLNCHNCRRAKMTCNHSPTSQQCPRIIEETEKAMIKVNYDY